jgi:hypothetical protein
MVLLKSVFGAVGDAGGGNGGVISRMKIVVCSSPARYIPLTTALDRDVVFKVDIAIQGDSVHLPRLFLLVS